MLHALTFAIHPRRRARGQLAVMTVFLLILLIFTAGTFVNVSQAVTRKIHAQMVADAAAFTGAANQARGLNALTKTNRIIGDLYSMYYFIGTIGGTHIPWPVNVPAVLAGIFETVIRVFRYIGEFHNVMYAGLAYHHAKENAYHNCRYLFGRTPDNSDIVMYGGNYWVKEFPLLGGLSVDPLMAMIPAAGIPTAALTHDSEILPFGANVSADFTMWYIEWILFIPVPRTRDAAGNLWLVPNDGEELRFYWVVQLPETRAMFMPNVMKIPPVTAVGSAKAFGGNRGPEDADDMHDASGFTDIASALTSSDSGGNDFNPEYRPKLCPTSTDFILHFYLFGTDYYRDNALMPSLMAGVLH